MLAHADAPLQPHDVWTAWSLEPSALPLLLLLAGVALAHRRGWRRGADAPVRGAAFAGGMLAVFVALVSPLDALSVTLVSAHMVQHVLLILVAAPLLAVSAAGAPILRGTPAAVRHGALVLRRAVGLDAVRIQRLRAPVARWLFFVVSLWLWHAAALYGAAIENELVHVVEHATFFTSAYLVWSVILGPSRVRMSKGLGLLAVFTLGLQSIFLSVLLTFASEPWYSAYLVPPEGWGLDPLTDQQLAGAIMWIPAGFVHTGIALWLFVTWLRETEAGEATDRVEVSVAS